MALGGSSSCAKLDAKEVCALRDGLHATTDVTSKGDVIHCTPPESEQEFCLVGVEKRFAARGLVVRGYRFLENERTKAEADAEALVGIGARVTRYPQTKGEK